MTKDTRQEETVDQNPFYDLNAAAACLGICRETLCKLIRSGEIPHTRIGKRTKIRKEDLEQYIVHRTSTTWKENKHGDEASPHNDEEYGTGK